MPTTYEPIATTTLGVSSTITFTSIPSTYTDLRVVINGGVANNGWDFRWRFNSDSGANYSETALRTDDSGISSARTTNSTKITTSLGQPNEALNSITTIDIFSYTNSNVYKTCLARSGTSSVSSGTSLVTGMWRSTSAINSIFLYTGASNDGVANLNAGTIATLYGIKAA